MKERKGKPLSTERLILLQSLAARENGCSRTNLLLDIRRKLCVVYSIDAARGGDERSLMPIAEMIWLVEQLLSG